MVDRHILQYFIDAGHKQKSIVLEQKPWMVQYNSPLPLENQRISPTQMFYNEQTSSDNVKDRVKDMR